MISRDQMLLESNRIVSADRSHPAHANFDTLRTRIVKLCADNAWSQIIVTSPTRNCGKTTIATNLSFSMARNQTMRTLLVDLDMRAPSLKRMINAPVENGIDALLTGRASYDKVALRLAANFAACVGTQRITDSAELLLQSESRNNLEKLRRELKPLITIYDMPPLFGCDDTLAFLPYVDAVLLVAAAGTTTADDIRECEQLIAGNTMLIGIIMNKIKQTDADAADYGYDTLNVAP
jgi:Mrp family chromosome partitioning ATPase